MIRIILITFSILTVMAIYSTYTGFGLQEVISEPDKSVRSSHSGSSSYTSGGSWGYGK